jgi:hypothetical protein
LGNKKVFIHDVQLNYKSIGAIKIEEADRDSHSKVIFPRKRAWTLDINVDPIPERFLKELIEITGLPNQVIRYGLLFGQLPIKRLRIQD